MAKKIHDIKLGAQAKDRLTGFTGHVTGKCEYLSGGDQVQLASIDSTGRPIESWVPAERIEQP